MGFRKIRAKKYSGIYEYFKNSDNDKATIAYYISYRDIDNTIKKVKCTASSKDDALKILNDKRAELTKDRNEIKKDATLLNRKLITNNLTLEDVAKLYFPTKVAVSIDMITSDYYRLVNPILGKAKIAKIKTEDIKNLSDALKEKNSRQGTLFNPRTVKKVITHLRALFNWAIKQGYIERNPVIVKEIIKVDRNEPGRVLSDEELEKLWNLDEFVIRPRLFLFLKTCYHTRARPSGVLTIQVKHINFSKGPIQLYKRAKIDKEKESIKNTAVKYGRYAESLRTIFDRHFNQDIGTYDLAYRVSVYTMRRTAATKVYKKFGIVHAKRFLNHTEIDTTMKYLNIEDDMELIDYGL